MYNKIPWNHVSHDYVMVLHAFVAGLADKQPDNLQAVFLTGSYARGEATNASSLDLWCLYKKIGHKTLAEVGELARFLSAAYGRPALSVRCLTETEFQSGHFAPFVCPPAIRLESVLLYGGFPGKEPSSGDLEGAYKQILATALMDVRRCICADEPREQLTHHRLSVQILKPVTFALRLERYLHTGRYPRSTGELLAACDPDSAVLVEWFIHRELLERNLDDNHRHVLGAMARMIERLL